MSTKTLHSQRAFLPVLFTLLLCMIGISNVIAQTFTVGNINYSLNDDGVSVTVIGHLDGTNATGELVIPESVDYYTATYTVTVIGENAFNGCNGLTSSLVIPETVTSIGASAFRNCHGLTGDLTIPNSVTYIGSNAFESCDGFTGSLTIGTSLAKTGERVFANCSGFTTLYYNATSCKLMNIRVYIGNLIYVYEEVGANFWYYSYNQSRHWLYGCNSLTTLNIGQGVTKLPYCFLDGCSSFTGDLVIPESVTTIEWNAFNGCSGFTGSLTIPQSVITLDNSVFANCNGFTALNFNAANCTSMSSSWLSGVTSLTTLSIGENVHRIPDDFVTGKSSITGSLTIPNAVIYIGSNAFSSCTGFSGTLTLGQSVSQIGNSAFFDACAGFTSFNVMALVPPTLGNNVFISADYNMPVQVPCGLLNTYQNAEGWNVFTNIQEPNLCLWDITAMAVPTVGGTVSGAGTYEQGQTCTLTATPNEGYEFVKWLEGDQEVSTDSTYSFTVEGDRSLIALFINPIGTATASYYPDSMNPESPYVTVAWGTNTDYSLDAQIGEGTSTFNYFPFYTLYNYSIAENLFLATELEAAGVITTPITSLSWYATNETGYNQQGISIWMANVDDETLSTASHVVTGMTLVYTGAMTPHVGWNEFVFNQGTFSWDGHSNILIYCQRNNGEWNSSIKWQATTDLPFNASSYRYQDSGAYDATVPQTMYTSTTRPNTLFKCSFINIENNFSYKLYRTDCDGNNYSLVADNVTSPFVDSSWLQLPVGSYQYGVSYINDEGNESEIVASNCIDRNLFTYQITASANPEEGGTIEGAGNYPENDTCTLTATPSEDYAFVNWTENGEEVSTEASYSFTVVSDRNLVANFRNIRYNVWVTVQPAAGGTVSVNESGRSSEEFFYNFEDGMQGWTTIDADGDGYNWRLSSTVMSTGQGHNYSSECMVSQSWYSGMILYPDNYLVSPQVALGGSITFYACAQDANYAAEHFGVAVSVGSNTYPSDFQMVQEWTMSAKGIGVPTEFTRSGNRSQGNWYQFTVDLSAYAGMGYVAIRHFNCNDMFYLDVDDITISQGEASENYSYLEGETCTLTAVPNEGWTFYRWEEYGEEVSTEAEYSFTVTSNRSLVARFKNSNTIVFADPNVEAICVANWDTDGDGFLSYDEAAAVTDLGQAFRNHNEISSFDELQHFTGLTSLSSQAFDNCSNLTSIIIPNNVNSIGWFAFRNCESLTEFTVPESVTYLDWLVLLYCNSLEVVNYNAINASINDRWIRDCPSLTTINIGENVQTIPGNAFRECSSLTSVVFSESVTTIGGFAFYGCSGLSGELTIPESVTSIGGAAFAGTSYNTLNYNAINCNSLQWYGGYDGWEGYVSCLIGLDSITTLNIGENVQVIPAYAFMDFSGIMGSIVIPNSVTAIGDNAFKGCSGLSGILTIPEAVTSIGSSAFGNTAITAVVFNAVECNEMGYLHWLNADYNDIEFESAFAGCSNISDITIGNGVKIIPDGAFKDITVNTNSFVIPNTVETIGNYAFDNVGISGTLIIPNSVTGIGSYAFSNNSLTTLDFNATNCTYIGNGWYWGDGVDIAVSTFYNCNDLTTLNIGNQVEIIPAYAFVNCATLTGDLSLPNSLVSIGESAFEGCVGFTGNLVIPNLVETIDHNAFKGCTGLSGSLTIGESAICINGTAFRNTYFSTMNYNATNCIIGGLVWNQWYTNQYFEYNSFMDIPSLTTLNIGNNVESISQMAFKDLTTLTGTLTLPNSLISIGDQAFYNCYGFEGIVMGNSVETIGSEAFRNCGGLRGELTLPETLLSVGPSAFAGCNEISTVNFNAINCTEMGNASENVFADCLSLAHIRIGADVQSIPNYAFKPCFLVTDMSVAAVVPPVICASTFGTVSRDIPVSVPLGSGPAYRTAQYWEEFFHITEDYSSSPYSYHWNVNVHQFGDNMTVIGIIQIDGVEQAVPYLEIGAFCNGECRGRQLLTYYPQVDRYLVFLMLYGEEGDMLTFKLYNHETDEESTAGCAAVVTFEADAMLGSFMEPYVFNFSDMQLTTFSQGYNWWSTYIEQEGINGLELLENGLGNNGVGIRSQANGYINYYGEDYGWWGSLSSINNESTYKVVTSAPCIVSMAGAPAVPSEHPITLNQGWTWMGYVPSMAMEINTALDGLDATVGDRVKSQYGYSEYYAGYGWFGSLNTIEPGMGLMYKSSNSEAITFTYPDSNRGGELKANLTPETNHWKPNTYAYPDNMTVMAVVELEGAEISSDNYELAAFAANGECRGSVRLIFAEPLHRHVAFLTVSGKDAAELSFRLYDTETNMEYYDAEESLDFVANAIVGTADDLYVVHFRGTTGMDEMANRVQVYPNPVASGKHFRVELFDSVNQEIRVEVINALGVVVLVENMNDSSFEMTAPKTSGLYTLRIIVKDKVIKYHKLVVE